MHHTGKILLRRTAAILLCVFLCIGTNFTLAGAAFAAGLEQTEEGSGEAPPPVCVCETLCGDVPNGLCPVCAADLAGCTGVKQVEPVPVCVCEMRCIDIPNADCPICAADINGCTGAIPEPDPIPESGVDIQITPPDYWAFDTAGVEICIADVTGGGFALAQVKVEGNGRWQDMELDRRDDLAYGRVEISENCTVYVSVIGYDGRVFEASSYVECFDRTAPDLRAVVDGQLLWVEVNDGLSGVDAVYIDGIKYTNLTNGTLDVPLRDLGSEFEQFSIQAVDRAGNRSRVALVDNPNYQPPAVKEDVPPVPVEQPEKVKPETGLFEFFQGILGTIPDTPTEPDTPAEPSVPAEPDLPKGCDCDDKEPASTPVVNRPSASATPSRPAVQTPQTVTTAAPSVSTSQTSKPVQSTKPLTPNGQGTVVDNSNGETGKQFYTFSTPGENVFYLVVDNDRDSENVYFLNAVTESDLAALAEQDAPAEQPSESVIPAPVPEPEPVCVCKDQCVPGEVDVDCPVCVLSHKDCAGTVRADEGIPEPEEKPKNGNITLLLVAVIILAVGGAGYYLKIYKPKHDLDDADDFDDLTGEEETINEDDLEPAPRRGPFDEPEEPDYMDGGEG